jgi:hypothetical protein
VLARVGESIRPKANPRHLGVAWPQFRRLQPEQATQPASASCRPPSRRDRNPGRRAPGRWRYRTPASRAGAGGRRTRARACSIRTESCRKHRASDPRCLHGSRPTVVAACRTSPLPVIRNHTRRQVRRRLFRDDEACGRAAAGTYNRDPLYRFVKGTKEGQTSGESAGAFGVIHTLRQRPARPLPLGATRRVQPEALSPRA